MKRIALTQGQYALVDDEDFEFLNQWKWHAKKHRNTFYAGRRVSLVNGKQTTTTMHHEIIGKPPDGMVSDHCSGCGIDNQRHNLRFVTNRQNGQNRRNAKTSSQYPGVCWSGRVKKWMAYIQINGKIKYLGCFTDELEAFYIYRQAVESIGEEMIGELRCL